MATIRDDLINALIEANEEVVKDLTALIHTGIPMFATYYYDEEQGTFIARYGLEDWEVENGEIIGHGFVI